MPRVPKKSTSNQSAGKQPAKKPSKTGRGKTFDTELKAIYRKDGKMPNLHQLDHKRGSRFTRFLIWVIVIAVVLSAIAWAGFLFFDPFGGRSGQTLEVRIEGPDEVSSGEEVEFKIRYENKGQVPLAALEIQLNLPDTFRNTVTRPNPTASDNTWTIGSLRAGSDGSIDITGTIIGSVTSASTIQAIISYRPSNFNADFQDIETKEFLINTTVLEGKAEGPEQSVPGDSVEYAYELRNSGKSTLNDVFVLVKPPTTFLIEQTSPEFDSKDQLRFKVDTLDPNETVTYKVMGSFAAEARGLQDMIFTSAFMNDDEVDLVQSEERVQTDVLGGALVAQTIVNGSDQSQTAELGELLRVSLNYANQGEQDIGGVSFKLKIESAGGDAPIAWEQASLADGKFDPVTNEIIWDESIIEELELLAPGTEGVIDLSLPIVDGFDASILSDSLSLVLTSSLESVGGIESAREISSSPIAIGINSDFNLTAEARYYDADGVALGTGPVPPMIDETTTYRVLWKVTNSIHDLEGLEVSATLPPNVAWTGRTKTDIGELSFDPESRLVRWYTSTLPTSIPEVGCHFEVSITPNEANLGIFLKLLNVTSGSSTDAVTREKITESNNELTTEVPNDEYATSGVVIEAD
ncbi:MAG: hypothetical protein ABIG32_01755 [Candidatus Uhrbacteria bacterium]|nr:hypothetical protein [Patescibacteria group bacterium]MBU1907292.1 hypothetical protein [Patescibacteria group bacterium]